MRRGFELFRSPGTSDGGSPGPKGDQGDKGDKGDAGDPGADGSDGTDGTDGTDGDDGESAYAIALDNGFVGTETAWLLSLIGATGSPGADGMDGAPGADGADATAIYGDPVTIAHGGTNSTSASAARTALGLDTAATHPSTDFASSSDSRLTDARTPTAHHVTHEHGGTDELSLDGSQIAAGTVAEARIDATIARDSEVTSAVAAEASARTTAIASEATARDAAIAAAIAAVVNGAPGALDTLKELADALGDDASYAASIASALALKAPLASPALTGTPTVPTASPGTNTTQAASTAYVDAATGAVVLTGRALSSGKILVGNGSNLSSAVTPSGDVTVDNAGVTAIGSAKVVAAMMHAGAVDLSTSVVTGSLPQANVATLVSDLAAKAPLASPAFTGHPTGVTETAGDQSTKLATTSFVQNAFPLDGWTTDISATWTAGSATQFAAGIGTAAASILNELPKGTKVSYNDGAVDYGVVASCVVRSGGGRTGCTSDVSANTIGKSAHGFSDGDPVTLSGMVTTTGVSLATHYFVRDSAANTFKLAATIGGTAIDLTGSNDSAVISVTPQALVTLIPTTDYSIGSLGSVLTARRYSYAASPQGWPGWFNYTPSFTGLSVNPTQTSQWSVQGNACTVAFNASAAGTSNSTAKTITLPVAMLNTVLQAFFFGDAGVQKIGYASGVPGSTTLNCAAIIATGLNTASGNWFIDGFMTYPF